MAKNDVMSSLFMRYKLEREAMMGWVVCRLERKSLPKGHFIYPSDSCERNLTGFV